MAEEAILDDEVEAAQAPAEAPAEDVTAGDQSTPDDAAEGGDDASKDAKPKKFGGVQKRISELTAQLRRAERALKEAQSAPEPKPAQTYTEDPPARESFEEYESYLDARAAWVARRESESLRQRYQREADQRLAEVERDRAVGDWAAREESYREEHPDYDEIARNPSLAVTQSMADVMMDLDNGPAVAYHLGQNPDLAEKLAGMTDRKQSLELARIAERLATQTKRDTAAPKPIAPVRSTGRPNTDPLSDKNSTPAWMENRRKQLSERRAR